MLANSGHRDEAIVEPEQAAELDPENVEYLYNLGVLYKDSGRSAEAEGPSWTSRRSTPTMPRSSSTWAPRSSVSVGWTKPSPDSRGTSRSPPPTPRTGARRRA